MYVKFIGSNRVSTLGVRYQYGLMVDPHGLYFVDFDSLHDGVKTNKSFVSLACLFGGVFVVLEPKDKIEQTDAQTDYRARAFKMVVGVEKMSSKAVKVLQIIDLTAPGGIEDFELFTGVKLDLSAGLFDSLTKAFVRVSRKGKKLLHGEQFARLAGV